MHKRTEKTSTVYIHYAKNILMNSDYTVATNLKYYKFRVLYGTSTVSQLAYLFLFYSCKLCIFIITVNCIAMFLMLLLHCIIFNTLKNATLR